MKSKEGGVFFNSKSDARDKIRNFPGLVGEAHLCLQRFMGNSVLWSRPQARRCWHPSRLTWLPSSSSRGPGVALPLQIWSGLSRPLPCGAPGWVLFLARYSWGGGHSCVTPHQPHLGGRGSGTRYWGPGTFPADELPQWVNEVRSRQPSLSTGV